ncbi:hypothetical protein C8F04DRAFT_1263367 [Mycena alexandri]|uniref:Uncharacterized protein n=1 Tax=Mycena alexandri TaxID=1745969 RepID=A0AAD6SNA1_9AGAR|nr:hypothetical protein C8F04DRAFT_1263367 [Mycena alexandri]
MPAHTWTTAAQFTLLTSHMAEYVVRHAQKKVNKVWPTIFEDFFRQNPVDGMLGIDKTTATPEQWKELQDAILAKKSQIKAWFRYQHKKTTRTTSARRSAQSTIGNALFAAKSTRRRVHRTTEVFQQRNLEHVREVLAQRGHNELNEEHMAVDGEDLEVQEARVKAARGERLRMRNEVVKELYETAPESEREAIAEAIRLEKENLGASAEREASEVETEQRQIAIDESSDVMEKVLKTVAHKTGWFSFAIWGGPNPRHDGELSLKCAVYGNTPVGNDFVAQHANFDEAISLPFQEFLRRCFENGVLRPPILPVPNTDDVGALDGLLPLDPQEETTPPAEKPTKKKAKSNGSKSKQPPKRMSKPKKASSADGSMDDIIVDDHGDDIFGSPDFDAHMDNISSSATEPLTSSSPSTLPSASSASAPVDNRWPDGMSEPTSPGTAARTAAIERGGMTATATYAAAVIDPALMRHTTPSRPRPCFNGAGFAPNRNVGESPTSADTGGFRWGGPSAPHLEPFRNTASSSQSSLPRLFGDFRKIMATSPVRAYRDQQAYRDQVAARPRADIFGAWPDSAVSPPSSPGTPAAFGLAVPTPPSAALPPAPVPVPIPTPTSVLTPAPASIQPPVPVYVSRPMANPTKAAASAAKAAKAAVTGNSASAVVTAAAKKKVKKAKRDVLTDVTNDISLPLPAADSPAATTASTGRPSASARERGSGGSASATAAPTTAGENVTLCVMQPGGNRAVLKRAKEAEKRIQAMEAERKRVTTRMHNPDGNHDLVCVPALRRSGRDGKVPARPDEGYVGKGEHPETSSEDEGRAHCEAEDRDCKPKAKTTILKPGCSRQRAIPKHHYHYSTSRPR